MTSTGAAHVELAGRTSRVGTGVAVLDHLLEELAEAGAFGLTLEIAPDAPEAEVGRAALRSARRSSRSSRPRAPGRGSESRRGPGARDGRVEAIGRPLVVSNADLLQRARRAPDHSRRRCSTSWRAAPG